MKRAGLLLTVLAFAAAGATHAEENPIKKRQQLMEQNGKATKLVNQMLRGEQTYDAAAAAEALKGIAASADSFIALFPEGSVGEGTDAKPEIWQAKADFDSWAMKAKEASLKAAEAAAGGVDALRPAFAQVGQTCKGCHEKYRVEK